MQPNTDMASWMVKIRRISNRLGRLVFIIYVVLLFLIFLIVNFSWKQVECETFYSDISSSYNRSSPFIFIGGFPHSGGTLVRNLLNVHPDIRCISDSIAIPKMLRLFDKWKESTHEWTRLTLAGVTDTVTSDAVAAFIIEILFDRHASPKHLCNEEPFSAKNGIALSGLFPHAKFIFMIRDGRAVIHSLLKEKIKIDGFNLTNYEVGLTEWSLTINSMLEQCRLFGDRCIRIKYEDLVLDPRTQIEILSAHLEVPNLENVINEHSYLASITDEYLPSLTEWVGRIPIKLVEKMHTLVPVLDQLGYDPRANPPNYGSSNGVPEFN